MLKKSNRTCRSTLKACLSRWAIVVILWIVGSLNARAQLKANIERYSTEHGLSHDGVLCMTRDKEGFMWFGTWDGLNRFDGHSFKSYKSLPGDSSIVKNNRIRNITEDKAGYLWVKTFDNLVYRFDKKAEAFVSVTGNNAKYSNIVVDKIVPVSSGDTWLLTEGSGLLCVSRNRFLQLRQYSKSSPKEFRLPDNAVSFVFEDYDKALWVGTAKGIVHLRKSGSRFVTTPLSAKLGKLKYSFTCALQDKNRIYFGTSTGHVVIFDKATEEIKVPIVLANVSINAICSSKSGKLYITSSGKGLAAYDLINGSLQTNLLPGILVCYAIFEDRAGRLWIEPEKKGVIKYNPSTGAAKVFAQRNEANASSPNKNYLVFEDVYNNLWVSLKGGGFGVYNANSDKLDYFYNDPTSDEQRISNIVTALYSDETGILWLSGNDGGVNKITFPGSNFRHQLLVQSTLNKAENEVRAMYEDRLGRLWLASKAGKVSVYHKENRLQIGFENISESQIGKIYSIIEDSKGRIWFATKGQGIVCATPVNAKRSSYRLRRYLFDARNPYSLSSNLVYSVLEDKVGRIWIGTLGGGLNLVSEKAGRTLFYNANNAFKAYPSTNKVIRHLQVGADGKVWVATTDGLIVVDPRGSDPGTFVFRKYNKVPGDDHSLGNNDVQYILKDRSGKMWIGTFGGGLNEVLPTEGSVNLKFRTYTRKQGLPNDIILSIVQSENNLWIATENGLSRFDLLSRSFTNYDSYDGLPRTRFSEATCLRSSTGLLYFGCIEGFISFNPKVIKHRLLESQMALTKLQIYNKEIAPGPNSPLSSSVNYTNRITLAYDQNMVSIDYTVLDYRATRKVSYAYILKGYDKRWNFVNSQTKATYTNLPPGNYEFIVKGMNSELFKTAPVKTIKIEVLPPPWRTAWAYLAYALLLILAIEAGRRIFITMIRLRNKVAIEKRLTDLKLQFFTNISHELRTPLTLIVSPLEEIAKTETLSARGVSNIGVVSRNANRMIRLVNHLLDFQKIQSKRMRLKIAEVEVVSLLNEVSQYFSVIAREKNIDVKIRSNVDSLNAWLDDEKLDIVLYNILSNAFKFSPAGTSITVSIESESSQFSITIADEGPGIPEADLQRVFELYYEGAAANETNLKGTGIGLALAKELVQAHHGELKAASNPGGGAVFIITLPTGKAHFDRQEADFVPSSKISGIVNTSLSDASANDLISVSALELEGSSEVKTVLLVEDNAELRKFLSHQLDSSYKVLQAADGQEGLKVAKNLLPDLIISDIMMPVMDGIQLLDMLKNDTSTSHIPVILLTAKSSVENHIEALRYGADFYITKPFHTDHILASVENLLRQRKALVDTLVHSEKKVVELKPSEVVITSRDEEFVREVIKTVEAGMEDSEFNIDDVAEQLSLGRTTFYKKLKSLTGLAPVEFVRDMRLIRAKQLLDSGEFTVSEVAYNVGFNSSGYFSTCFKEKFNMSPSEYLKSMKKNDVS